MPNPDPTSIALDIDGPGDGVLLKVFTRAMVLVAGRDIPQTLSVGWNWVPLGNLLGNLPNGIYFIQVQAQRSGETSPAVVVKVFQLKH